MAAAQTKPRTTPGEPRPEPAFTLADAVLAALRPPTRAIHLMLASVQTKTALECLSTGDERGARALLVDALDHLDMAQRAAR